MSQSVSSAEELHLKQCLLVALARKEYTKADEAASLLLQKFPNNEAALEFRRLLESSGHDANALEATVGNAAAGRRLQHLRALPDSAAQLVAAGPHDDSDSTASESSASDGDGGEAGWANSTIEEVAASDDEVAAALRRMQVFDRCDGDFALAMRALGPAPADRSIPQKYPPGAKGGSSIVTSISGEPYIAGDSYSNAADSPVGAAASAAEAAEAATNAADSPVGAAASAAEAAEAATIATRPEGVSAADPDGRRPSDDCDPLLSYVAS